MHSNLKSDTFLLILPITIRVMSHVLRRWHEPCDVGLFLFEFVLNRGLNGNRTHELRPTSNHELHSVLMPLCWDISWIWISKEILLNISGLEQPIYPPSTFLNISTLFHAPQSPLLEYQQTTPSSPLSQYGNMGRKSLKDIWLLKPSYITCLRIMCLF